MRNLSFALTTEQIRNRTKTVTRRKGTWWAKVLKPGDLLCAVEKGMGLQKGERVKRLAVLRIVSVRRERVAAILTLKPAAAAREVAAEGFPELTAGEFTEKLQRINRGLLLGDTITRIEFEYTDLPVPGGAA